MTPATHEQLALVHKHLGILCVELNDELLTEAFAHVGKLRKIQQPQPDNPLRAQTKYLDQEYIDAREKFMEMFDHE